MTTAAAAEENWKEVCLIGIIPNGGSETQWAGMTQDITAMDWGEKDFEGQALLNGGRVAKWTPMGDESITMKLYPVSALKDGTGAVQWFHKQGTDDATQPIIVDNTRTRVKHRIVLLWATTLPATAGAAIAAAGTTNSYRIQIVNAYMTSYKPDYSDKDFTCEVTFKWTPFNKAGTANKREESCDGSQILAAGGTSVTAL